MATAITTDTRIGCRNSFQDSPWPLTTANPNENCTTEVSIIQASPRARPWSPNASIDSGSPILPVLGNIIDGRNTRSGRPDRCNASQATRPVTVSTARNRPVTRARAARSRSLLPRVATIRQGVATVVTRAVTMRMSKGRPLRPQKKPMPAQASTGAITAQIFAIMLLSPPRRTAPGSCDSSGVV